jgi:hypothetical protein
MLRPCCWLDWLCWLPKLPLSYTGRKEHWVSSNLLAQRLQVQKLIMDSAMKVVNTVQYSTVQYSTVHVLQYCIVQVDPWYH